jgi:hypothetical protein
MAEYHPTLEAGDEGTRRIHQTYTVAIPGDNDGRNSNHLQGASGQSNGLVADRSDGSEKRCLNALGPGNRH